MSIKVTERTLTPELVQELYRSAQVHYRPENPLAYHNFSHVIGSLIYFEEIVDELAKDDVEVNILTGSAILINHDADFDQDHLALGYDSKEALSSKVSSDKLSSLHIAASEIKDVRIGIMDTHIFGVPKTNTSKATRYADVGNVADDNLAFQTGLIQLAQEGVQMTLKPRDTFRDFCESSAWALGNYYGEPLKFERRDGSFVILENRFENARKNIGSLSILDLHEVLEFTNMSLPPELAHWI